MALLTLRRQLEPSIVIGAVYCRGNPESLSDWTSIPSWMLRRKKVNPFMINLTSFSIAFKEDILHYNWRYYWAQIIKETSRLRSLIITTTIPFR